MGKRYYKMIDLSKDLEGYMRTVKEIDKQIEKEQDCVNQLYAQINSYEKNIERLGLMKKAIISITGELRTTTLLITQYV